MSLLALPRGSQATGLPEHSGGSPDPMPPAVRRIPGVRTTAPPNPERVKQESSTTMTTTASPPVETTTASSTEKTPTTTPRVESTPVTTMVTATPVRRKSRWSGLLGFLGDDQRDLYPLQREALFRLQQR